MGHYDIFCYFFNIEKCDLRTLRSMDSHFGRSYHKHCWKTTEEADLFLISVTHWNIK